MKANKKILVCFLIMIMCISMTVLSVFAAATSQDGLEVTLITDKTLYARGEEIITTLTVTNTNKVSVNNLLLETLVPDGYKLVADSEATKRIDSLEAGETISLVTTYVEKKAAGSSTGEKNTREITPVILIVLFILVCGAIIVRFVLKKKSAEKNSKKILSLFLCAAMLGTMAMGTTVSANDSEKSIFLSEGVTVENSTLEISSIVKYELDTEESVGKTGLSGSKNSQTVEEYYRINSKKIKEIIDAKKSKNVLTESKANVFLKNRGFTDFPITYMYSMDGVYHEEVEVSIDSNNQHPMYITFYVSQNNELWTIYIVDGAIMAYPVSFNLESNSRAKLLVSETEELTSYESKTNAFYVTVPKKSVVIVKVVETINTETLDKLTVEELRK